MTWLPCVCSWQRCAKSWKRGRMRPSLFRRTSAWGIACCGRKSPERRKRPGPADYVGIFLRGLRGPPGFRALRDVIKNRIPGPRQKPPAFCILQKAGGFRIAHAGRAACSGLYRPAAADEPPAGILGRAAADSSLPAQLETLRRFRNRRLISAGIA